MINDTKSPAKPQSASRPDSEIQPTNLAGHGDDTREQLFNGGESGLATSIQVSAARIFQVRGAMFDLDPDLLKPDLILGNGTIERDPVTFYEKNIKPLLDRHTVLRRAEVRNTGRGLHAIIWFDPLAACDTDASREDVSSTIEIVTRILPSDPMQPGITALTRAVGSVNAKTGAAVEIIKPGEPAPFAEVRDFAVEIVAAPVKTVCDVLFGGEVVRPCPVCRGANSYLAVEDHRGWCYSCGAVTIDTLWGAIYVDTKGVVREAVAHG